MTPEMQTSAPPWPSFREAVGVWAKVAALSFGGPAGQIAVMHRILVEERRWISEARFLHALNYCMLLPGPEAQQLATYIGWLLHGTRGGLVAGTLFVLPGAIAIMALSIIYALAGSVGIVEALFFGLKAAVLAVVLDAVIRVGKRALKTPAQIALAVASFLALFVFALPFPLVVLGAGLIGFLGTRAGLSSFVTAGGHGGGAKAIRAPAVIGDDTVNSRADHPWFVALACLFAWLVPVALLLLLLGPSNVFSTLAVFFSKMAMVTFGGAYAVLAYVAQQAVEHYRWVTPGEMLDGLGMAETTPGPLIMVLQFVGFLAAFRAPGALDPILAGVLGGLLTTWVTFAPCFLWIFLGAPYIEVLRANKALSGALAAITAAVVGVILNLALWFGLHALFRQMQPPLTGLAVQLPVWSSIDLWATGLAAAAVLALLVWRRGALEVIGGAALIGITLHLAGLR